MRVIRIVQYSTNYLSLYVKIDKTSKYKSFNSWNHFKLAKKKELMITREAAYTIFCIEEDPYYRGDVGNNRCDKRCFEAK